MCKSLRPATLLKKDTLAQVISCKLCEIFKNTFLIEHPTTASMALKYFFCSFILSVNALQI